MTGAERCCSKLRISDSGPHRGFRQCQELPVLDSKQAQRHRILPKAGKKPRWEVKHRAHGGTQEEPYRYQLKSQSSYSFIVNLWPEIPIPSSGATQKPSQMSDGEAFSERIGQCFAALGGRWVILEVQSSTNHFKEQSSAPLWTLILVFYPRGAGYQTLNHSSIWTARTALWGCNSG